MHEQSKISALLMTKNSTTVSMDSDGKSQFASTIGAVSIDFLSERIATYFAVKLKRNVLQKPKKKTKTKTKHNYNIQKIQFKISCSPV